MANAAAVDQVDVASLIASARLAGRGAVQPLTVNLQARLKGKPRSLMAGQQVVVPVTLSIKLDQTSEIQFESVTHSPPRASATSP